MSAQTRTYSISNPGFFGLNLQDSPVDMPSGFALSADNCVIDSAGRIAARLGWAKSHTANTDLSTSNITCLGELVQNDGTRTVLATGGAFLFKLSGTTLTTLTYGGGGVAPTISAANWKFCQLNGIAMFWQRGYDTLIYDPAVSTTTFRRLSEKSGATGTFYQCNEAISAYGRVWAADTSTDKNTVVWSDLLTPHNMTGGTSGSLNIAQIWPRGGDEIVALAAHNGFLIIFGKTQILTYVGADDPANMKLHDAIATVGCVARDSVQTVGGDLIFLSSLGLHTLGRVIQEKSSPIADISRNVRDTIVSLTLNDTAGNIKSVYSPRDAFYLISFPAANEVFCFDMRSKLENGASRTTTWNHNNPKAFMSSTTGTLYFGQAGYIGSYSGYLDDADGYRIRYVSPNIDFGEPVVSSIMKKILLTVISREQNVIVKWAFDFVQSFYSETVVANPGTANSANFNIDEYNTTAEYTTPVAATIVSVNAGGVGKTVQIGLEVQITGYGISLQKIDVFTKRGKLL